jgi:hypothetical protein
VQYSGYVMRLDIAATRSLEESHSERRLVVVLSPPTDKPSSSCHRGLVCFESDSTIHTSDAVRVLANMAMFHGWGMAIGSAARLVIQRRRLSSRSLAHSLPALSFSAQASSSPREG